MATGEKQSFPLPGAIAISGYYSLGSIFCTLQADEKNVLWIGTANGLAKFDMSSQKIVHIYKNNPKNRRSINSNEIKCILPDPGHPETTLWVGTTSGLNKLDKKSGLFRHYGINEGLPNNTVYGILSDKQGDLWISTNQGIAVFNPLTEEVTTFDYSNGLQSNEFNTGAYFKSSWGEMFLAESMDIIGFIRNKLRWLKTILLLLFQIFNYSITESSNRYSIIWHET
jgi:streptogramin lyase